MTERSDIGRIAKYGRRLSYTRRCGWIDWGHAQPGAAVGLRSQIVAEMNRDATYNRFDLSLEGTPAYTLTFGGEMKQTVLGVRLAKSTNHLWVVKKGLSRAQRERVALGIYLTGSLEFEQMQSSFPYSWRTDSGFSAEDLMSNLVGFYVAFRGYSTDQMRRICGEVSVEESYRVWDEHTPKGLGVIKIHKARPILFSTSEGVRSAADLS